ncbi:PLP-dependent aminotransferase family protein [Anaeromyxobacter sp. Fw109-5]|uniref:aminotransferase-like domain-containing protein n=1 Tax=Anaeromyxobacter sp. (strain Fw109-5) TaxID=404589 RepID=UPI0000ED6E62|nr:PLP-dependent aminotransferase family protein [Anaeromyxobacter sp. Fw109-5]ABS28501.1 putative transcriptional regulator, GntR family [Anaeromyxobacter sp. Fw109-5]
MTNAPDYAFAARVASLRSSAIREILRVVARPDVISFAGGLPAPELFPTEALASLARELLVSPRGPAALQYAETEGHEGLRARILGRVPFPASAFGDDGILVTQGSQQGLDLLAKLFLDPGDEVLVETPAYLGAVQVFRFFGARVTFLPCDADGLRPDALADALRRRPKLLYLTPTFQNPSGLCYPEARRREVREVLRSSDVIVLEDDPYRDIWFDAAPPPPVVLGHDPARAVYLGSFSKTAVPGLRVGFLLGPPAIVRRGVLAKQATDLQTNTLGQHLLFELLGQDGFARHVEGLRREYRARRDALEGGLAATMGDRLSWNRPGGGMFLWARIAAGGDAAELLTHALAEGLAFVPGGEFHREGEGKDTLRLNFTHSAPARIAEGVARLARAFERWRG